MMQRSAFRPLRAEIDLSALRHNYAEVKRLAPTSKVWAVVKANAYGHGLVPIAQALSEADGFAVASLEEALVLRKAGVSRPILLLEGVYDAEEYPIVFEQQLSCVLHCTKQLHQLNDALRFLAQISPPLKFSGDFWIKLDTGMHRLGFLPEQFEAVKDFLQQTQFPFRYGLMSHFATADEDLNIARHQLHLFRQYVSELTEWQPKLNFFFQKSIANSAAIQALPEAHLDWIRPGIMLYGGGAKCLLKSPVTLKPVMRLKTAVIALKWVAAGACVGYGCDAQLSQRTLVGIAAVGYGDGYPRSHVAGREEGGGRVPPPVYCEGQKLPRLGRVSMDMLAFDATSVAESIHIGSDVELWGTHLEVDAVAEQCGTIGYDLLCGITERVPRYYLDKG